MLNSLRNLCALCASAVNPTCFMLNMEAGKLERNPSRLSIVLSSRRPVLQRGATSGSSTKLAWPGAW
jgi:hypothetical protein